MILVKKAVADDFEKIYPLLLEFNNPNLTKDDWKQLFVNHCSCNEDYFGYVLFDKDRAVGFLGLIFSDRLIDGKLQKFCNITSWIITKDYRGRGLSRLLMHEVVNLTDYTITTLPPSPKTEKMHREQGFKVLEDSYLLILPIPTPDSFYNNCSIIPEQEMKYHLDVNELKIYNDHLQCKCSHILIKTEFENCYIIIKKIKRRGMVFAEIHYLSNLPLFLKFIDRLRIKLPLYLKVVGLLIEKRFLKGHVIKYSFTRKFHRAKLFKSSSIDRNKITDNLYTELLVLNI